jgi:hypothetical protein
MIVGRAGYAPPVTHGKNATMKYKILASSWWTPPLPGHSIASGVRSDLCIGAVAIQSGPTPGYWKAYMGYGIGGMKEFDEQLIAERGEKLNKFAAGGIFPELDIEDFLF